VFRLAVRCASTRACNQFSLALSDDGREFEARATHFLVPLPSGLDPDAPGGFGSLDIRAADRTQAGLIDRASALRPRP
jgi:hypothetical protein